MKVYADYFKESNCKEYRKKTLLHFGEGTNLLGSAVLMNPGSAKPIGEPDSKFLKSFYGENHQITELDLKNWKTFSPDSTMGQLEKIFNGWYLGKQRELNGVIQLFNCFYFRNQNFREASKIIMKNPITFQRISILLEKLLFGWVDWKKWRFKTNSDRYIFKLRAKSTPIFDSSLK